MQLTLYTDYSLRVLIYLSLKDDTASTISEIANYYEISRNHLVKVVHNLSQKGFIHTARGKGGGMRLARPSDQINVGEVVRETEPNFHIVECFNPEGSACSVLAHCNLKQMLGEATQAFLGVLDRYTVADLVSNRDKLMANLGQGAHGVVKIHPAGGSA